MFFKYSLLVILSVVAWENVSAQRNMTDSILATPLFGIQYGGTFSGGDLKERYGYFNHVGATIGYKFPNNWYMGVSGNFLFGNQIHLRHSDLFGHLMDKDGLITAATGGPATIVTFSRGIHVNIEIGKVLHRFGHNKNSGLWLKFGTGYLNHRIRIESNEDLVPLLEKDYRKGYDRYTAGLNTSQFVGYLFLSNRGFLNFYAGFFMQEGFTQNKRKVFFDRPDHSVSTKIRMDVLYGFKVGWIMPLYRRIPREYYYD